VERRAGAAARGLAWTVVHLRPLFILGWIAAAVLATIFLPTLNETEASSLSSLVPKDSRAVAAELTIVRKFGFPLFSRVQIVQRDPKGLSPAAQARAVGRASDIDRGLYKARYPDILGAIPVTNTGRIVPGSRENSTTALTYLFVNPQFDIFQQRATAELFAHDEINRPDDASSSGRAWWWRQPRRRTNSPAVVFAARTAGRSNRWWWSSCWGS
jgi:RND superfamily putative drug exporter